jgi:hypothetical protein
MKRHLFSTALVAVFCMNGLALAQSGPAGTGVPAGTPAITTAQDNLSEQALEAALRALDPNLQITPTKDGKGKLYDFKVSRDGWNYDLRVESYANGLWLNAKLSSLISAPQNLPPAVLAELLKLNFQVGPSHFAFMGQNDNSAFRLVLCRLLDRKMSGETFNAYINDFLKTVKDSYSVWSQVR